MPQRHQPHDRQQHSVCIVAAPRHQRHHKRAHAEQQMAREVHERPVRLRHPFRDRIKGALFAARDPAEQGFVAAALDLIGADDEDLEPVSGGPGHVWQ